jgi:DNA-binding NarL/FixJ family response regulator
VEVADRWHLLHNLAAAVERTCHQHRSCLRKNANDVPDLGTAPDPALDPASLPDSRLVRHVADRHQEIHDLVDAGWTISAIARRLGAGRKALRRYATVRSQSSGSAAAV